MPSKRLKNDKTAQIVHFISFITLNYYILFIVANVENVIYISCQ